MKLSIIIPVYNSENYLSRCLDSILKQDFEDFELILVDDGSVDRSWKICQQYQSADVRVKAISIENKGPAGARNIGIDQAQGEYIGFVDADDFISPQMFKVLMERAQEQRSDIVLCGFFSIRQAGAGDPVFPLTGEGEFVTNEDVRQTFLKAYYSDSMPGLPQLWNKIYRRAFLQEFQLRLDESLVRAEDYWFNFHAFYYAGQVSSIKQCYYHYFCDTPNSVMATYRKNQFVCWEETRKKLLSYNEELNFSFNLEHFYKEFALNSFGFMIQTCGNVPSRQERKSLIYQVLRSPVYRQALHCCHWEKTPVKLLAALVRQRWYLLAYFLLSCLEKIL